jgi:glutathione S-transferase
LGEDPEAVRKAGEGGGSPDAAAIRAARTNLRYHLRYIGYLAGAELARGDNLTYADLARRPISPADYLGDVPWDEDETARDWYARVKSRPAFRPILATAFRAGRRRSTTRISIC